MNRLLEKISSLFDESKKGIGFGCKTKIKNSRKVLLFQQLKPLSPIYEKFIDGVIYKDLEFDKLKKLSNTNLLNGLFFPDRLIKLEKLENCDFGSLPGKQSTTGVHIPSLSSGLKLVLSSQYPL